MLVIFDCDGVLIDSEHIAARIEAEAANSIGHKITEQEILENFVGRPSRFIWEMVTKDLGHPLPEGFLADHKEKMAAAFANELFAINGVGSAIAALPFAKCVASSTELSKLLINLETTRLLPFFGGNVFSASQVARAKPFPDLFLFAAKTMGFEPKDCLVIEDSVAGVNAARAANMETIGFLGASHIQNGHDEKLLAHGAVLNFDRMDDLYETIKKTKTFARFS